MTKEGLIQRRIPYFKLSVDKRKASTLYEGINPRTILVEFFILTFAYVLLALATQWDFGSAS